MGHRHSSRVIQSWATCMHDGFLNHHRHTRELKEFKIRKITLEKYSFTKAYGYIMIAATPPQFCHLLHCVAACSLIAYTVPIATIINII